MAGRRRSCFFRAILVSIFSRNVFRCRIILTLCKNPTSSIHKNPTSSKKKHYVSTSEVVLDSVIAPYIAIVETTPQTDRLTPRETVFG